MKGACPRVGIATALLLCGLVGHAAGPLAARPVAQVLDEAVRAGLRIVYSSQSVPADLRVVEEPHATDPLERLREILRPHGLNLSPAANGVWVVTRATSAAAERSGSAADDSERAGGPVPIPEVTVTGSRYTLRAASPIPPLTLTDQDLEAQPALLDDPLRAIRRFPGTAGTSYSSKTHVRGGQDNENLIVLDGVPLIEPFRRLGQPADLSLIDPEIVDRVEFYPGVFPVEYGGRMSSVTRLESQRAKETFGGRLGLGFITASALLEGHLPRPGSDWLVSVRRSTLDLLGRALEPDIGHPKLLDLFASAHWQARPGWQWSFGVLSGVDEVELAESDGSESSSIHSDRLQAWIVLDAPLGPASVRTRLAVNRSKLGRKGQITDKDGADGDLIDQRNVRSVMLAQDGLLPVGEFALRWGWQAGQMDVDYDYSKAVAFSPEVMKIFGVPALETFQIDADSGAKELAAYTAVQWQPLDSLAVDVGGRWERHDYDTDQTDARWDPRISLLYRVGPRARWRLAWGAFTQFASAAELPVDRGATRYDDPSRSSLWVLGWDYAFARDRLVRVEVYDRGVKHPWPHLESLINPLVVVPELRPDQFLVAPRHSHAVGLDLHVFGPLSKRWSGWLSYSLSSVRDRFDGGPVPRSWDQRHALVAGLTTERWGWNWTAMLTAHSGWPTSLLATSEDGEIVLGSRNDARLPWYATLDLKAQHLFDMRRGRLRFVAEVTNATNRSNRCCSSLDFTGGDDAPQLDQDNWLPLLPLLSVAWEF